MFADSLLQSSWTQRSRRGLTTLSSFGIQAVVMGVLLLIPLLRPIATPFLQPLAAPIALAVPHSSPPAPQQQHSTAMPQSNMIDNLLVAPRAIPNRILNVDETAAPPPFVPVECPAAPQPRVISPEFRADSVWLAPSCRRLRYPSPATCESRE